MNQHITPDFILFITIITALIFRLFSEIKQNTKKEHLITLLRREFTTISCFMLEKNLTAELWNYVEKNNQELKNNDEIITSKN